MSVIWNAEKLWSDTESKLRKCDRVIEKLMDYDEECTANIPLDEHEIKECRKALALCGLMLSRIFCGRDNGKKLLVDFVFHNETEFAEKLIVRGNNQYVRKLNEDEIELDEQYEISERVKRGIAWLDGRGELGTWEPCITEGGSFDLKDPCNCVGGSIFGKDNDTRDGNNGFKRLCVLLEADGFDPVELGFASNGNPGDTAALQKEWILQVGERL